MEIPLNPPFTKGEVNGIDQWVPRRGTFLCLKLTNLGSFFERPRNDASHAKHPVSFSMAWVDHKGLSVL